MYTYMYINTSSEKVKLAFNRKIASENDKSLLPFVVRGNLFE